MSWIVWSVNSVWFVVLCVQILYNGQPIVKVACGAEFSMVVDCKGNIYSFGCPEYGQLGNPIEYTIWRTVGSYHLELFLMAFVSFASIRT